MLDIGPVLSMAAQVVLKGSSAVAHISEQVALHAQQVYTVSEVDSRYTQSALRTRRWRVGWLASGGKGSRNAGGTVIPGPLAAGLVDGREEGLEIGVR
jgi:hypothetical protein